MNFWDGIDFISFEKSRGTNSYKMKNLLTLIVTLIFIISCHKNESPFYLFEETNEVSTILLTEDQSGLIIEVANLNSIENLGFSPYEFFIMQDGILPIRGLTINNDTIMTISFDNPSIPVDIRDFIYRNRTYIS